MSDSEVRTQLVTHCGHIDIVLKDEGRARLVRIEDPGRVAQLLAFLAQLELAPQKSNAPAA